MVEFEFEAKHEVGILFFGEEVAAAIGRAIDDSVFGHISGPLSADKHPTGERAAVEQLDEALWGWRIGGIRRCAAMEPEEKATQRSKRLKLRNRSGRHTVSCREWD